MKNAGQIDQAALESLIEWHIESKTDALVIAGTTGEAATLTSQEKQALFQFVIQVVKGRLPVIANTGTNATQSSIYLTKMAMEMGADACLLVTPYYNKPTQEGLYQHYHAIAEAVPIPQILYNVPSRTACDMLPETVARLAKIPNIIGIKEATGQLQRAAEILNCCPPSLHIYSGDDATTLDLMKIGAKGVISVTANVAPAEMHNMCDAMLKGDIETAEKINATLMALHKNLFIESNPIPVKWALAQMGRIENDIRLPLTILSSAHHEKVQQAMFEAGINYS
jgi:4-hydroxy-tetrahydrodipicolinate synthase